jgi:hypothetical protein
MTADRRWFLTWTEQINPAELTMNEMIFWSDHNVHAFICSLIVIRTKKLKK